MAVTYANTTVPLGLAVTVSPGTITVTGVNRGGDPVALPELVISRDDLRQRADFADFSLYAIGLDLAGNRWGEPFNTYAVTKATKETQHALALAMGVILPVHIFIPTMDCDFTECGILVHVHPDLGLTSDVPAEIRSAAPLIDRITLRLTAPAEVVAGGTARCVVDVLDGTGTPFARDCMVYLESTGAYLPKQRIGVIAGRADFDAVALGLVAGDAFRIKAGFKHYSGVTDATIAVV